MRIAENGNVSAALPELQRAVRDMLDLLISPFGPSSRSEERDKGDCVDIRSGGSDKAVRSWSVWTREDVTDGHGSF